MIISRSSAKKKNNMIAEVESSTNKEAAKLSQNAQGKHHTVEEIRETAIYGKDKSIRTVRREYGALSDQWIINSVASKLQGRAAEVYTSRLSHYNSLDALLTYLKT